MIERNLARTIESVATSDGAGVRLRRSLGAIRGLNMDPFLMLDEFSSDDPDDYIAGFPEHPHRGFETVTYMIDGHMRHEDHLGNRGDLGPGGVQWMTAGRGIIHSEMPQQEHGVMRGFQLWLNLPAAEKMTEAGYRDLQPEDIPEIAFEGGKVKLIAGSLEIAGQPHEGAMPGRSTQPIYADIHLTSGAIVTLPVPEGHNAMLYLYEGKASLGETSLQRSAA